MWQVEMRSHARDAPQLGYEGEVSILVDGINRLGRSRRLGHRPRGKDKTLAVAVVKLLEGLTASWGTDSMSSSPSMRIVPVVLEISARNRSRKKRWAVPRPIG